jgi:hypothetical protein
MIETPFDVTVVVPTIGPRIEMLRQARESIWNQTLLTRRLVVQEDVAHEGAAATRHKGLMRVRTPWVAFLDDDDLMQPDHLEKLLRHALDTGADYVFSWFWTSPSRRVPLGATEAEPDLCDPFPVTHFTDPWDPAAPRQTTVTTLVRTELAREVGFAQPEEGEMVKGQRAGEDWVFTLRCNELGKISHLPERTWRWRHWGFGRVGQAGNTSGLGSRW